MIKAFLKIHRMCHTNCIRKVDYGQSPLTSARKFLLILLSALLFNGNVYVTGALGVIPTAERTVLVNIYTAT